MADTVSRQDEIAAEVASHFKCFGVGSNNTGINPIGIGLADRPASFAMGVDVAEVVRFVMARLGEGGTDG